MCASGAVLSIPCAAPATRRFTVSKRTAASQDLSDHSRGALQPYAHGEQRSAIWKPLWTASAAGTRMRAAAPAVAAGAGARAGGVTGMRDCSEAGGVASACGTRGVAAHASAGTRGHQPLILPPLPPPPPAATSPPPPSTPAWSAPSQTLAALPRRRAPSESRGEGRG